MAAGVQEGMRHPLDAARRAWYGAREKIMRLNPAQRRVLFGMLFFLLVNAVILAVSIIVFSLLLKKL